MSDSNLKKQINNLRNTLFEKDKVEENNVEVKDKNYEDKEKMIPANINSKIYLNLLVFFMILSQWMED